MRYLVLVLVLVFVVFLLVVPPVLAAACPWDTNADDRIDILDVQAVAGRWNTKVGDLLYAPKYDFNTDGRIDILDVQAVAGRWNTLCP